MSVFSRLKRLAGKSLFHIEDSLGKYRLEVQQDTIVSVLMYHGLETDPIRLACNDLDITPESCLEEIRFFQKQGYELISADELSRLSGAANDNRGYLIVSFDDGHLNAFAHLYHWLQHERIPLMIAICPTIAEQNGVFWWEEVRARFDLLKDNYVDFEIDGHTVSFSRQDEYQFEKKCRTMPHEELLLLLAQLRGRTDYLSEDQIRTSKYVHENMNWEQITALAQHPLCSLAAHSLSHEIATSVPEQDLKQNTEKSKRMIEEKTGCSVRHYVYPNGECSDKTDRIIGDCGFAYTYSVVDAANRVSTMDMRLSRFQGCGFASGGLRHYARKWNKRHAAIGKA